MAAPKNQHVLIENIVPTVDGGRYPAKAILGDECLVEADVFRDGTEALRAVVLWRHEKKRDWSKTEMVAAGNDRWQARFPLRELGGYEFKICAWTDEEANKADLAETPPYRLTVDRPLARLGAWYQMFVRSQGKIHGKSGTFSDALARLEDVKKMGFDVIYLEPIHPVGRTARKGRNNSLTAGPHDPGSPWAVGNENGGHTSVEPALGTLADFDRFVKAADNLKIEIALDFAPHCSPDHPWVKEHPEWFYRRPDGSINTHENPPFKYEDVYPLNFDAPAAAELTQALLDIFHFWIEHGVKIFRIDNPHTKPVAFWAWVIGEIKKIHPDAVFLAEAFTRPKVMKALSKAGFTQSYTYFIWRNSARELADYIDELAHTEMRYSFRPNFFVTTPDVFPRVLHDAGAPAFKMRMALAATLSPSYGIVNGFELLENKAMPGTEEYLDSEKYEYKVRDWNQPGNIKGYISKINSIRRANSAFHSLDEVRFIGTDNESVLGFVKMNADKSNTVVVVANMDPHRLQQATVHLPLDKMGFAWSARFGVEELIAGGSYQWGEHNTVILDPNREPVQIFKVNR